MPILLALYVVLPVVQLVLFLAGRPPTDLWEALNYASSLLSFHWLSANVLISAKLPQLQRVFPYDARIRFHILASAGIAALVLYHGAYKLAAGKFIDVVSWSLLAVISLMLLFAVLWIPVPGFVAFRTRLVGLLPKLGRPYDASKSLHGTFVLVFAFLLFLHIVSSGLLEDVPAYSSAAYALLFLFSFGAYVLSKTPLASVGATVTAVERKREILTIRLRPDRAHRFRSGQFAFLRARGDKRRREEHPFSYLSRPVGEEVSFAVRACGDFTKNLAALKAGDRIRLRGGFGNFRPGKEPAICFIASGIGSVPFLSILKELHARADRRLLRFFLAVDHEEEIPDGQSLAEIERAMPNLTLRKLVYSQDGLRYSPEFFARELDDPRSFTYYVCSSPRVRTEVVRSLKLLGVGESAIRYEAFALG